MLRVFPDRVCSCLRLGICVGPAPELVLLKFTLRLGSGMSSGLGRAKPVMEFVLELVLTFVLDKKLEFGTEVVREP